MTDNRFYNDNYYDAVEYTKDILKNSSSIDEIIYNIDNIKYINENKDDDENKTW